MPMAVQIAPDTLCVIDCIVNLTDTFSTHLTLRRVEFADPPFNSSCLSTVLSAGIDSSVTFTFIPDCGDPTIESELQNRLGFTVMSLSPNPTDGLMTLDISNRNNNMVSYEVFDVIGQTKMRGICSNSKSTIDLQALSSGSYFIRFSQAAEVETRGILLRR